LIEIWCAVAHLLIRYIPIEIRNYSCRTGKRDWGISFNESRPEAVWIISTGGR
jgi:hypothetical protein